MQRYRWPILFFLAVSFWNLVGAGLFGFLINTPLALYYMQGLNLTPLHGHTALFGVYGMLGIGLMLFCLRGLKPDAQWNERHAAPARSGRFNIGLALMALLTLLPIGVLQLRRGARARLLVRALGRVHGQADHPHCWCGCACPATRSSASARCCSRGSCSGCGSRRGAR